MPIDSRSFKFMTARPGGAEPGRPCVSPSIRRHRRLVTVVIGTAASLFVPGVTAPAHAASVLLAQPNFAVGITQCTFTDTSRPVPNFASTSSTPLAPSRVLVTELRYPTATAVANTVEQVDAPPATRLGGFPMIVFAHGFNVVPSTYAALLDYWVRQGFIVASPVFPDENRNAVARQPGVNTELDLVNEPADLAFVTRQIVADSAKAAPSCPLAYGLINPAALALAGHSDGAVAVGMLANSTGRDPQGVAFRALRYGVAYRAAIIMAGDEGGRAPYQGSPTSPALLVVQSAVDRCNVASGAVRLYRDVRQTNKWFLELLRAHHLPPFDGADAAAFKVVTRTTTQFLQMALESTSNPTRLYVVGNESPGVALIFHAGAGPSIAPPTTRICGLT